MLKQNSQSNKVVTSKPLFLLIGPFCILHFICLNMGLSTQKNLLQCLKIFFVFQKIYFKVHSNLGGGKFSPPPVGFPLITQKR